MFRRDPFGHVILVKKFLISSIGWFTWRRYARINKVKIEGGEILNALPERNVLFVSNHQTYFADVIALLHVFCAAKNGKHNSLNNPFYLMRPKHDTYFVAAEETMKKGWLPRVFAYVGSVSIQRTWRDGNKDVKRKVRMDDLTNIGTALENGWLINFPQGTTKVYAPGRRGVALLVKKYNPIVVPVVIDGFRRAFNKKGLLLKKKGVTLTVRFKQPMQFDGTENADDILAEIMRAIEQSPEYRWEAAIAK